MTKQKKTYEMIAISQDEKRALPIGTHYFKLIFDDVEGIEDVVGYYASLPAATRAFLYFAEEELDCGFARDEEFLIKEYVVDAKANGEFLGRLAAVYTNVGYAAIKIYER